MADILRNAAQNEISANGRNWYFTSALEAGGIHVKTPECTVRERINSFSMFDIFSLFRLSVNPTKSLGADETAYFFFIDTQEHILAEVEFLKYKYLHT